MSFHPELWVKKNNTYLKPSSDTGLLLPEEQYIAFGQIYGALGYGIRDNGGVMQFKNEGGSWAGLGSVGSINLNDLSDVTVSATDPETADGTFWVDIS
jgi:hypothetical protein